MYYCLEYPLYEHVYKSCFKKLNYKNIYYSVIVYGNEDISAQNADIFIPQHRFCLKFLLSEHLLFCFRLLLCLYCCIQIVCFELEYLFLLMHYLFDRVLYIDF